MTIKFPVTGNSRNVAFCLKQIKDLTNALKLHCQEKIQLTEMIHTLKTQINLDIIQDADTKNQVDDEHDQENQARG